MNFNDILSHYDVISKNADKLANNTWQLYSTFIQINCIVTLAHALLAFLSWVLVGFIAVKLGNRFLLQEGSNKMLGNTFILLGYIIMIYGAKSHLIVFADIWNWVGLFKPNMYVIHQVLDTVNTHNNVANLEKILKLK